jgi:hypothetical protein
VAFSPSGFRLSSPQHAFALTTKVDTHAARRTPSPAWRSAAPVDAMIGGAYPLAFLTFRKESRFRRRQRVGRKRASVTHPKLGDDDVARLFRSATRNHHRWDELRETCGCQPRGGPLALVQDPLGWDPSPRSRRCETYASQLNLASYLSSFTCPFSLVLCAQDRRKRARRPAYERAQLCA